MSVRSDTYKTKMIADSFEIANDVVEEEKLMGKRCLLKYLLMLTIGTNQLAAWF